MEQFNYANYPFLLSSYSSPNQLIIEKGDGPVLSGCRLRINFLFDEQLFSPFASCIKYDLQRLRHLHRCSQLTLHSGKLYMPKMLVLVKQTKQYVLHKHLIDVQIWVLIYGRALERSRYVSCRCRSTRTCLSKQKGLIVPIRFNYQLIMV